MNYLFSRHDPGLLEKGPHYGKKSILLSVVPSEGKDCLYLAEVPSFLHGLEKKHLVIF
jgi:hypothetical protein